MDLGDNVEVEGFVVSRVWMMKHKNRAAFNVHVRWKKEGEKEKTALLGSLTDKNKGDLAAVRALLVKAAEKEKEKEKKRKRQDQEEEKDDDDGPLIGEKESGRCVCLVLIVERGLVRWRSGGERAHV